MSSAKSSAKTSAVGSKVASGNSVARALAGSPLIAVSLYLAIAGGLLLMAGLSMPMSSPTAKPWRRPLTCSISCAAARAAPRMPRCRRPSIPARRSWKGRP